MNGELERRERLRTFLVYLRSRLSPADVGLPGMNRRRVPGLRRGEVAELIGVSEDWYRWFESGRPVSVSTKLIARLADGLRLNAYYRVTLHALAIPEVYSASGRAELELPASVPSNLTPISFPSDIDEARRRFDAAREAFLVHDPIDVNALRARIIQSWERSRSLSIDATTLQAPMALARDDSLGDAREEQYGLLDAAWPIVSNLTTILGDMGYAVSITDGSGRVLQVDGDRAARRLVEYAGIVPGGDLSEEAVGTNGIGTVIADRRPLQIMAAEHFVEGGQRLTCTGAPIRHPRTGTVVGVLVVMSDYKLVRSNLLPSVVRSALEIEEQLANSALLPALAR